MTHGVITAYRKGCRCDACRAASARLKRGQRSRHREHYRAYDRLRWARRQVAAGRWPAGALDLVQARKGTASR